jgi:uncharacterized protein (DUF1810 family)
MGDSDNAAEANDPFDLDRFVEAQAENFRQALSEIESGRKESHWMWYVFPQFVGLGMSSMSRRFSIKSADEARAYLKHPVLGPRLVRCCVALMGLEGKTAGQIFGPPDDMKLRSCATLFARVSPAGSVFEKVLEKYFGGEPDPVTLRLMESS